MATKLPLTTVQQELPPRITTPATAEPTSMLTHTPAKHLPRTLPDQPQTQTQELLPIPLPAHLPTIVLQDLLAIQTTVQQDPLEQPTTSTIALQDLLATATALTTAEATPDHQTILPATLTTEATATLTPDHQAIAQAAIPTVTPDRLTVLPAAQATEAVAVPIPDPPVVLAAIQDRPAVQAAAIQVEVVPQEAVTQEEVIRQEAPSPEAVQEAMLQEDKFRIHNPLFKSISH